MDDIFLETERLILRRITEADAQLLLDLDSDPEVRRFVDTGPPADLDTIRAVHLPRVMDYYARFDGLGLWAAVEKTSGAFVGWFHLRPFKNDPEALELGFRLKREVWGMGYATEVSRALIAKGFEEFDAPRIVGTALAANRASRRVLEKVGMRHIGDFVEEKFTGADKSAVIYGLEREDYGSAS